MIKWRKEKKPKRKYKKIIIIMTEISLAVLRSFGEEKWKYKEIIFMEIKFL